MLQEGRSIFNQQATEKLRSPDDLDKYVRVTNPSVWVVLAACVALLAGLLAWGVFGSVTTSIVTTGTKVDSQAMCFLSAEDVAKVSVGDAAKVGDDRTQVGYVAKVPLSPEEAKAILGNDYLVATLVNGDWAYQVTFTAVESTAPDGVPLTVSITTERIAPIRLILGGNA